MITESLTRHMLQWQMSRAYEEAYDEALALYHFWQMAEREPKPGEFIRVSRPMRDGGGWL